MTVATVGDLPALGALRSPGRVALKERESGRELTYAELDRRTNRLANALLGLGLEPGDRVAAWMEDCLEYVELYLAVAKAGLAIVPINARFRAGEATHQLVDSGARALAWTPGLADRVAELDAAAGLIAIVPGALEDLVSSGDARRPPAPNPDDLYILGYTSGTTGTPKGAMLTHRGVLAIARLNSQSYRLPIYGTAALTGSMSFVATVPAHIVTHLYIGGTCVLMGDWDVESLLDTIARERATFTYVPSPLISEFAAAARARPRDWESLQSVLHSASRADPGKLSDLCEVIGGRFVEGWGMTENCGGLATATARGDATGDTEALDVFASAGRAAVECVVEVVDPDGAPLPHDGAEIGELVVRSPALMSGYWGLPDATAGALRDGWYHSGDLGSIDPAGYVYVSERRHDLIVSGGMNVYPSEVERCISQLPGVADCAVVGAPHERWGQTAIAFVVRAPGAAEPDEAGVVEHCRARLASFKKPTAVLFVDDLPRTPNLKLDRVALRAKVAAGR